MDPRKLKLPKIGRKWWIVIATFVATAFGVLLIANLTLGDKKIDEQVPTLYTVADPQFARVMNVLLGPAILPGNRVQALVNGDRIFPAMLEAIREWENRPWTEKLWEHTMGLLSSQL